MGMVHQLVQQAIHAGNRLRQVLCALCVTVPMVLALMSCEREPVLYLHHDNQVNFDFAVIELSLDVYWDYNIGFNTSYDWRTDWYYGWDDEDNRIFGHLGYVMPTAFNIRRYYMGETGQDHHTQVDAYYVKGNSYTGEFRLGYWDLLVWNEIGQEVQSVVIDETSSLDSVIASTNQTMNVARYNPRYTHSFNQPEELFAGYEQGIDVNRNLDGFTYDPERNVYVRQLNLQLEPRSYIYLTQIVIHNNRGRVTGTTGIANLSGMARSTNLNTGVAGNDPVTVSYNVRMKNAVTVNGEQVDIIGGRLVTFGLCGLNPGAISTRSDGYHPTRANDRKRHLLDVDMQFNNGTDSTLVFDVTEQVAHRFRGGVITIDIDMDTIPIPHRSGGSAFDAVVDDYDEEIHVIDM